MDHQRNRSVDSQMLVEVVMEGKTLNLLLMEVIARALAYSLMVYVLSVAPEVVQVSDDEMLLVVVVVVVEEEVELSMETDDDDDVVADYGFFFLLMYQKTNMIFYYYCYVLEKQHLFVGQIAFVIIMVWWL